MIVVEFDVSAPTDRPWWFLAWEKAEALAAMDERTSVPPTVSLPFLLHRDATAGIDVDTYPYGHGWRELALGMLVAFIPPEKQDGYRIADPDRRALLATCAERLGFRSVDNLAAAATSGRPATVSPGRSGDATSSTRKRSDGTRRASCAGRKPESPPAILRAPVVVHDGGPRHPGAAARAPDGRRRPADTLVRMDTDPTSDATPRPLEDDPIGYAVDRFGSMRFTEVLASLVHDVDLDTVAEAIHEFGLQAVAEHYLRRLIDDGVLHADAAAAAAEEDRLLDADPHASPTVHAVTVADVADEFTRLDLTDPASTCR